MVILLLHASCVACYLIVLLYLGSLCFNSSWCLIVMVFELCCLLVVCWFVVYSLVFIAFDLLWWGACYA